MSDEVDLANDLRAELDAANIADVRRLAEAIPKGAPGECEVCGEYFGRIVGGLCCRCRDREPRAGYR